MFNPGDWKEKPILINQAYMIAYTNKHTGLDKLKVTFTREQQRMLEIHKIKYKGKS